MKTQVCIFFAIILSHSVSAQNNVWSVSNISIEEEDQIETIKSSLNYSEDDILIWHGNAINKLGKKAVSQRVKKLRKSFDRVYVIPGSKEWDELESKRLKKLGDYLDDEYKGDVIVPENSCGSIEVKELDNDVALLFIDSHWFFSDWYEDRSINKGCDVASREEFWVALGDEVGSLKAKRIFLFTSHPIMRSDNRGGYISASDQLFPLKKYIPGLYLPLPIVGTMLGDTEYYLTPDGGSMSALYQEYTRGIKNIMKDHGQITVISSDANYTGVLNYRDCTQININSGDKSDATDQSLLYKTKEPTYLQINLQDSTNNKLTISNNEGQQLWYRTLRDQNDFTDEVSSIEIDEVDFSTLKTRSIRLEKDLIKLNKILFGSLNSKFYSKEVSVPQLDLTTAKGGLKPVRLGGGMQTVSLRLEDENGQIYLARSLKKDPEKSMPVSLRIEPFENIVEHYFMAANPLGFLTASTLESSANILHTTPQLMYLPKQEALRPYNDEIGDELVLFRERADDDWRGKESYGYSKELMSSSNMIEKLHKNKGKVDAEMYLRARLVDYLLNDWDRHADQWRWAEIEKDDEKIYQPIPRDRDQVFSQFNGWVINILKFYSPDFLQLRSWDDHLSEKDITWMHFKSAMLDNLVLHQLSNEQWKKQTGYIKENITAETVETAMSKLPPSFAEEASSIQYNMQSRLEDIENTSQLLKKVLKKKSLVMGSDDEDKIYIDITKNSVSVKVKSEEDGEEIIIFENTFTTDLTEEIWIMGLDDDDEYIITGDEHSDIDLLLLGGYGKDTYDNQAAHAHITVIDDQKNKSDDSHLKGNKVHYRYITDKNVHSLDRFDMVPTYGFIIPTLAYNTDNGLTVGATYTLKNTDFKAHSTHVVGANYIAGQQSSQVSYKYNRYDELTRVTKYIDSYWSGIQRQLNYYGGNASLETQPRDYYDVNLSDFRVELGLSKSLNRITQLSGGIYTWSVKSEDTENSFVTESPIINPEIFERKYFVGLQTEYEIKNFNSPIIPTKGARINLSADARYLFEIGRSNVTLKLDYDYYKSVLDNDRIVFSTKLRVGHVIGDYYLYEGLQLGGPNLLRGQRIGRYTGRTLLAQNSNVHIKIFNKIMPNFFPSALGITGSFDHGRVWSEYDLGDQWQYTYGGGLWLSPLDFFVVSAGYHIGEDNKQLRINFGWQF